MRVAGDPGPRVQWRLRSGAGLWGRACEVLVFGRGGPRPGSDSRPAEVGLDLFPGNAVAFFGHGRVEGGDVLCFLKDIQEFFVSLHTHQDGSGLSVALKHDRLGLGGVDDFGEFLRASLTFIVVMPSAYNILVVLYKTGGWFRSSAAVRTARRRRLGAHHADSGRAGPPGCRCRSWRGTDRYVARFTARGQTGRSWKRKFWQGAWRTRALSCGSAIECFARSELTLLRAPAS